MAKKIRFSLEMDNGVEVRSMEELREHFSLVKVLEYFENGKLVTWLRDRYEDVIADAVEALDQNEQELAKKLSEIFDVPYDEKTEEKLKEAEQRAKRLERLKAVTDDEQFWEKIDYVAFEQDELYDLLDEKADTIYLCGDRFSIPLSKLGVSYIGINNPTAVIDSKVAVDWNDKKISIEGVTFDEKYQAVVDCAKAEKDPIKKVEVKRPNGKTMLDGWVETSSSIVDEKGLKYTGFQDECLKEIATCIIKMRDDKFEPFTKLTTKDNWSIAKYTIRGIFQSDSTVIAAISDNGTIEKQLTSLYNGWKKDGQVVNDLLWDSFYVDPKSMATADAIGDAFSEVFGAMLSKNALEWEKIMGRVPQDNMEAKSPLKIDPKKNYDKARKELKILNYGIDQNLVPNSNLFLEVK